MEKTIILYSKQDQQFQMSMQVEANASLNDARLIQIIEDVLGQVKEKPIKNLKLNVKDLSAITFEINQDQQVQKLSSELKQALPEDLRIKIVSATARALPKNFRSIKEIRQSLLDTWPSNVPVIKLLWNVAVHPLSLLGRLLFLKKYDISGLDLVQSPHDKRAFLTALEWSKDALDLKSEDDSLLPLGEEFTLAAQFKEAIETGKGQETGSKQTLAKKYAEQILERFEKVEDVDRAVNLMLIPTGYWKDRAFEPVLLAFYRHPEGYLALTELTYGQKNAAVSHDFGWKDGIDADKLSVYLAPILGLTEKTTDSQDFKKDNVYRLAYLKWMALKGKGAQNLGESEVLGEGEGIPTTVEAFRQGIWGTSGAVFLEPSPQRRMKVNRDPQQLVHETIRLQFSGSAAAEKAVFTLAILNDRLEKVLKALPQLREEEKRKWLHQLEKDQKRLERQLGKASGDIEFKDIIFGPNSAFSSYTKRIEQLKGELTKLERKEAAYQKKRLALFTKVKSVPTLLKVPEGFSIQAKTQKISSKEILAFDLKMVSEIQERFENPSMENVEATLEQLKTIAGRLDELVDQKKYQAAKELYRSVMSHLPLPISGDPGRAETFYDILYQVCLDQGNSQLLDQFSASLEKFSHFFWEAKIKTADMPLTASDWVHAINQQAVLLRLIEDRKTYIESIYPGQLDLNALKDPQKREKIKETLSYEDLAIYLIRSDINYDLLIEKLILEKHLKPSLSPDLEEKFTLIRHYFKEAAARKDSSFGLSINSLERVHDLYHKGKERDKVRPIMEELLIEESLYRRYAGKKSSSLHVPYLPGQMVDLLRAQTMFVSQLFPDTSFGETNEMIFALKNTFTYIR
ncbi:MAG: hypothetical protein AB7E63_13145, partial [Parachlamydia sp.]